MKTNNPLNGISARLLQITWYALITLLSVAVVWFLFKIVAVSDGDIEPDGYIASSNSPINETGGTITPHEMGVVIAKYRVDRHEFFEFCTGNGARILYSRTGGGGTDFEVIGSCISEPEAPGPRYSEAGK